MKNNDKWDFEKLQQHIRTNTTGEAGMYSATIIIAGLYKKLYGHFPKIGMSGMQAECAQVVFENLPGGE